ncbi:protein BCAP isoform X2 [Rhineura floridana]|uniref:protein BCAP isoform X2 n=1 Tax=Rhineura floridana TaxID=261503 RepID=UPI002AC88EA8|nr:protein BCAP isoform X2 [Rhineura floridana]
MPKGEASTRSVGGVWCSALLDAPPGVAEQRRKHRRLAVFPPEIAAASCGRAAMEGSGKEEEALVSSLYEQNSDVSHYQVQRELFSSSSCEETRLVPYLTSGEAEKLCSVIQSCDSSFKKDQLGTESSSQLGMYLSSLNEEMDSSDDHVPESRERESLKENSSLYSRLVDKHRTRMKELLPCLKGKPEDCSVEERQSESEAKWLCEDAIQDDVTFQRKLRNAELAIGSAEMFLPSFKETLARISKLISRQIEDLIQKLTESETEAVDLKNEALQKERYILELSTQLQQEKANVIKASRHSESIQSVQIHLQCQIERKEAENNQLRTKFQTVEKKITERKLQVGEYKQQILAEKEKREERRNALKRAASVQKQRAELLKAAVESLISKIREKEIQLSEVLSACNVWKSHHETVVDEKNRLEVQAETLKKQIADHVMELERIRNNGRKSNSEILGKLSAVTSENENISLENAKLKASFAALKVSIISAEAELVDLHEEAQQQENLVEHYKTEVGKIEIESEELKTRYEKVIRESINVTDGKDLEMVAMRGQTEARLKELERARDLQKAAEGKLRKGQESLLVCQKSCLDKSKTIREFQVQVGDNDGFLKQLSLEEENRNIQLKYEEVKRKLEEMELQNKKLENQLANQEACLQKTELQFQQKLADYDALTRQLEAALEDGSKKLEEEMEKINSKERAFRMKILDLENELRRKKEEQKHLSRRLDAREKHRELSLKELEHSLQRSENQNQSIQNYVKFLKTSYVTMFS